jgi:7-carboxy-7-deazaguanine synthase
MSTLRISEIFKSLQGETSQAGKPCVLVRLAGCNLRCAWCDTVYAQEADQGCEMTLEEVLRRVNELGGRRVAVTGGEPLLQPACRELLRRLCDAGCDTLLETNGSVDISGVEERVRRIVDVKCPSSGYVEANVWDNLGRLTERDEVKFVLADRADYDFARRTVEEHHLIRRCDVIFSPVWDRLAATTLAEWILADDLDVRLGIQLHKILWPGVNRGV